MTTTSDSRRYYGLDALRGGMMLLGLVLHSGGFFLAAPPPQLAGMPMDRNTSYLFDVMFHFIHSFRMPLFFVLAGFFAALLVEKRGMRATYKDRAARIVAPMLVGCLTVVPLGGLFALDLMLAVRFDVMSILPDRALLHRLALELKAMGVPVDQPSIFHLWFLLYLCYFYVAMPVCEYISKRSLSSKQVIGAFLASPLSIGVLGLFTALTLWPFHGGQVHEGFLFLKPHLPSIGYYGSFFLFGYLFHAHRGVLGAFVRFAPLCTALSIALFPLSLWLSYLENYAVGDITGYHLAAVIVHGLCTWTLIYACTGWMLRLFDRESPWVLYVSQSAYWVYLVHLVFTTFMAWILSPYDLPAIVKFSIILSVATVACFTSYHYLVQRTWVSRFLHGKRFNLDWPWRVASPARVPAEV
jgi:glucan biosynthesis protein C